MRRLRDWDFWTSVAEVLGGIAIVAGSAVVFGVGVALMVAGVGLLAFGYLASGGSE